GLHVVTGGATHGDCGMHCFALRLVVVAGGAVGILIELHRVFDGCQTHGSGQNHQEEHQERFLRVLHGNLRRCKCKPLAAARGSVNFFNAECKFCEMRRLRSCGRAVAFCLSPSSLLKWAISRSGIGEMTQVRTKDGAEILVRSEMEIWVSIPVTTHSTREPKRSVGFESPRDVTWITQRVGQNPASR